MYATRSTSIELVPHFDNPKKFYHRNLKGQIQSLVARPVTPTKRLPIAPPLMDIPWSTDTFKPLDTFGI